MKPAQIVLLLVALVAAGLAAFLATRGSGPAPVEVTTQVVQEKKVQILVAKTSIGVAERLTVANVEWQDWPEGALRSDYVTIQAMPEAANQLAGSVARFEFFPGEPIREEKLVHSDQGYLSAVLEKGKRGVSIPISAPSAAGGYIVPNDHVDVVLTHGSANGDISEVILANVKVLAIGQRLGEKGTTGAPADPDNPRAELFGDSTIATLELDPAQGETLINSSRLGQISLTLRSVADFNEVAGAAQQQKSNQPIRVIRYGKEASVISSDGSAAGGDAPIAITASNFQPIQLTPGYGVGAMTDGVTVAPQHDPAPPAEPVQ